jgi:hypothetical protein
LHNEELHNLYSSPDIIRQIKSGRMRWAGHVACMGEERKFNKVLVGKPVGKTPLGKPRRWLVGGITMDLGAIGLGGGVDWIRLAQDRHGDRLLWVRRWTFGFLHHGAGYLASCLFLSLFIIIVSLNLRETSSVCLWLAVCWCPVPCLGAVSLGYSVVMSCYCCTSRYGPLVACLGGQLVCFFLRLFPILSAVMRRSEVRMYLWLTLRVPYCIAVVFDWGESVLCKVVVS